MPTTVETRAQKIERYVELDALDLIVRGGIEGWEGLLSDSTEAFVEDALSREVWSELWPDDGGPDDVGSPESSEAKLADARSRLLAARLFERLSDTAHSEARYYRELGQQHLIEVASEKVGGDA